MRQVLASAFAVATLLAGSAAFPCGIAPNRSEPGIAGTAVGEGNGQVSIFTASATGYSWDRVQLPSTSRTHVLDVQGLLDGVIETDARVTTAISAQSGSVVLLSSQGITPLQAAPEAQTTVFGAALDMGLHWQVVTYLPASQTLALFSESAAGDFAKVATLHADCGTASMLDVVAEPSGTIVTHCAGQALEFTAGAGATTKLPTAIQALARSSTGFAVAYGVAANGTDLARLTHAADGWTQDETIPRGEAATTVMALSETSVVVKSPSGFTAFTRSGAAWQPSTPLDGQTPVTAASGSPAQVLSGAYELTLHATDGSAGGQWTTTDLGPLGVAPVVGAPGTDPGGAAGCSTGVGSSGWALAALALLGFARFGSPGRRRA
jgi:hypothetical protein